MEKEAVLYQSSQLCPLYFACITFPGLAGFTWIFLPRLSSVCFERCLVWGCFSQPQFLLCLWPVMHLDSKSSPDVSPVWDAHVFLGSRLTHHIWILQSRQVQVLALAESQRLFVVFRYIQILSKLRVLRKQYAKLKEKFTKRGRAVCVQYLCTELTTQRQLCFVI